VSTSCFFCQNLLSDYLEGILPSVRHEEIRAHLEECQTCGTIHQDLKSTVKLLHALPTRPISHELALRVVEAAQSSRGFLFEPRKLSRVLLGVLVPALLIGTVAIVAPERLPFMGGLSSSDSDSQFVRYYPLAQGAAEILEEQAAWLHSREAIVGSLWEEGGLSPEEFEKTFQFKSPKEGEN